MPRDAPEARKSHKPLSQPITNAECICLQPTLNELCSHGKWDLELGTKGTFFHCVVGMGLGREGYYKAYKDQEEEEEEEGEDGDQEQGVSQQHSSQTPLCLLSFECDMRVLSSCILLRTEEQLVPSK